MKQFAFIITAVLSLLATGCIYDREDICPEPIEERENAFVNLCISVAANNPFAPGQNSSRAIDDNESFFGEAEAPYEEIHTLRVLMVNPEDNKIEYNEYIKGADGSSTTYVPNINMRTTPGGKRIIYLIANESYVAPKNSLLDGLLNETMKPGTTLPNAFRTLTINTAGAGKPFFDNGTTYVPMTEIFEVDVPELPKNWEGIYYMPPVNLFVTRAAVKFSFIFQQNTHFEIGEHYRISDIKIHSTGTSEYLFPYETTYNPVKSLITDNREITNFTSPSDNNPTGPAEFTITPSDYEKTDNYTILTEDKYGILKKGDKIFTFAPPYYFPETKLTDGCTMDVTVEWLDDNSTETYTDIPLTNLPNGGLPRNTHVLVIISAGEYDLTATVKLVPYIGVTLDPIFGFKDLIPRPTLSETEATVVKGRTITLKATADSQIIWSSSDTNIATVDENGVVTGVELGTATITAKISNGGQAKCKITVVAAP